MPLFIPFIFLYKTQHIVAHPFFCSALETDQGISHDLSSLPSGFLLIFVNDVGHQGKLKRTEGHSLQASSSRLIPGSTVLISVTDSRKH